MGDEVTNLVECHSGSTYAERPIAFYWQGKREEIEQLEAEWRTPSGRSFRVCTLDGRHFELRYDEFTDEWTINPT